MVSNSKDITDDELPYATGDITGTGGRMKLRDEDFVVEEVPLYEAGGSGTHVYFTIEKRGLTTPAAIRSLAKALNRKPRDFGYAGLKDAHGITRQRLSLEHVSFEKVEGIDVPGIRVLDLDRHTNKIKLGHLTGNRFHVRVRDVRRSAVESATRVMETLIARGVPNYFGPQRFGIRNDNVDVGLAVLRGDFARALSFMLGRPADHERPDVQKARRLFDEGRHVESIDAWPNRLSSQRKVHRVFHDSGGDARKAWRAVDQTLRRLILSAVQSQVFNEVLASRLQEYDQIRQGDVAWKHANGSCFLVEDADKEATRCVTFEISASGPLPGKKMKTAEGEPGRIETDCMERLGLIARSTDAQSSRPSLSSRPTSSLRPAPSFRPDDIVDKMDGARRPFRVPIKDASIDFSRDRDGDFLAMTFQLPAGAYATSVTREICKDKGRYHHLRRFG